MENQISNIISLCKAAKVELHEVGSVKKLDQLTKDLADKK